MHKDVFYILVGDHKNEPIIAGARSPDYYGSTYRETRMGMCTFKTTN